MLTRRSFIKGGLALLAASSSLSLLVESARIVPGERIELMTKSQADAIALSMLRARERALAQVFNNAFGYDPGSVKLCA